MILAHGMRIPSRPNTEAAPLPITAQDAIDRYPAFLLDAYGVLVDGAGPLPYAREFIAALQYAQRPFAIVTNDASRSPVTYAQKFAAWSMAIAPEQIVPAGGLLPDYFATHGLAGARTLLLGTADSAVWVTAGGGEVLPLAAGQTADVIALCDDAGYPFLQGCELALSTAIRTIEQGLALHLVLPNPDLIYPKGHGEFGFTAGAAALMIEAALARRFPERPWTFTRLGKPGPALLQKGARQLGATPVMIGDQLDTDIAAANAAALDSALLLGGVSPTGHTPHGPRPTYVLESLALPSLPASRAT